VSDGNASEADEAGGGPPTAGGDEHDECRGDGYAAHTELVAEARNDVWHHGVAATATLVISTSAHRETPISPRRRRHSAPVAKRYSNSWPLVP
jgi:hypothetical protein